MDIFDFSLLSSPLFGFRFVTPREEATRREVRDRGKTVKSISTEGWIRFEESVSLEAILFLGSARLVGEARLVKRNWKETKRLEELLEEDTIGRAAFSCKNEFSGKRGGERRDYVEGIRWRSSRNVVHLKDGDK